MTWLSWINWLDAPDALITPDAEIGQLVAQNLRKRQASSAWRTLLTEESDSAGVSVDFGRAREVQSIAMLFPRENDPAVFDPIPAIGASDTIRYRLSAVSAGAGELYDSGAVACGVDVAYGYHHVKLNAPVNARYLRVDIAAPSRVDEGYLDVARLWVGPVFQPSIGFSYGDSAAWQAAADITRARRGSSEYAEASDPTQTWSMTFEGINDSEKEQFENFERRVTAAQQFLIARNDRPAARAAMFARQSQAGGVDSLTWRRNRKSLRLVENV